MLCAPVAHAHTPYQQWRVYRQRHLVVGTCKADPESYPLGKRIVERLAQELPESNAQVARAPDQLRLASLVTTDQVRIVILTEQEGVQLRFGRPPFEEYGPYPLTVLMEFGRHLMLAGQDLPDHHGWLVCHALSNNFAGARVPQPASDAPLLLHPGAAAFAQGKPMPAPPADADAPPKKAG